MLVKLLNFLYLFIFARKFFYKFNVILFKIIIKSLGYNNYGSYKITGEENFVKLLNKFQPKLALDIGANIGNYSKILLEYTKTDVIAFEPNKFSFNILKKLKLKYKNRFDCFNLAVSNKSKKDYLFYGTKTSELASINKDTNKLKFIAGKNVNKMQIKLITLDTFYLKNKKLFKSLEFIKIDTEGHELEVLKGSKKLLKILKPKFIQIEFNSHQLLKSVTLQQYKKFLKNYNIFRLLPFGDNLLPINEIRPENNIFHLCNLVFVRKDLNF